MQAHYGEHSIGQCGRHRGIGGVGQVNLAVHQIVVHLSAENELNLRHRCVKGNLVAAVGDRNVRETLGLKPGDDPLDIIPAHAKAVRKLRRRQPLVVIRRGPVLQLG